MLEILANSFRTATREPFWSRHTQQPTHESELYRHEIRKREELHRQQAHTRWLRKW